MTTEGVPPYHEEERNWLEKGGISPERVTRQIDRKIISDIARLHPEMLQELKEDAEEELEKREFTGILLVLTTVYTFGDKGACPYHDYPVKLSDLISGVFVENVQWLWDLKLAAGDEPNGTPLDETRWRGGQLVKRLSEKGFLVSVPVPSDDYTTWDGWRLGEKGAEFVRILFSDDSDNFVEAAQYLKENYD